MGEYIPRAPIDDEAKKYNQNLPGMGGVFNYINLHAYHYAGNNPAKLTDPNGRDFGNIITGLFLVIDLVTSTDENRLSKAEALQDYINDNPDDFLLLATSGGLTAALVGTNEGLRSAIMGTVENLKETGIDLLKGEYTKAISEDIGLKLSLGGMNFSKENASVNVSPSLNFRIAGGELSIGAEVGLTMPLDSGQIKVFGLQPDPDKFRSKFLNATLVFSKKL
jgi:hypothetical protein